MPLRWQSRQRFDGILAGERSLAGQEASFGHLHARALKRLLRVRYWAFGGRCRAPKYWYRCLKVAAKIKGLT